MSLAALIIGLFPLSVVLFTALSFIHFVKEPLLINFLLIPVFLYLYPLLSFRLHNLIFPLNEGLYDLALKKYTPWWGSFKIQQIYYHLPFIESLLQTVPGLYSLWLRLWGSSIGKNIVWTPSVEISDRSLMEIGDNVVFGHQSQFICHVISPKEDKMVLFIKKIKIGNNSFIGAASRFGPGVEVESNTLIGLLTIGMPRQVFKTGRHIAPQPPQEKKV